MLYMYPVYPQTRQKHSVSSVSQSQELAYTHLLRPTPLDAAPPPRSAGAPPPHPAHAHPRTRHYLHRTPTSPGAGSGAGDGDGASAEDEERDARSGLGFIARGFVTDDRYIDRLTVTATAVYPAVYPMCIQNWGGYTVYLVCLDTPTCVSNT